MYSFFNQFYVPAEQASLPALVPKKFLPQANSLFFITMQVALVLGFGIAGLLYQLLGFESSLYLIALLLFFAFLSVTFLPNMATRDRVPRDLELAIAKFFTRIVEGYKFIKSNGEILAPFLLLLGLQASLIVIIVNIPAIASEILTINVELSGILIIVPAGIGALIGAVTVPKLLSNGWRKKRAIELFLTTLSFAILLFGLVIPELDSYLLKLTVSILTTLVLGMSFVGIIIPSQTFLQEKTPKKLRGRVFGNFWFLVTVVTIFPVIFSGTVSELFGVRALLLILSVVSFLALYSFRKYGQTVLDNGLPSILANHE